MKRRADCDTIMNHTTALKELERTFFMRLDKYLKVARIIKRRTVANEACDAGRVQVNDKAARASYDVKIGDVITVSMGQSVTKYEVLSVTPHATKESAAEMFRPLK